MRPHATKKLHKMFYRSHFALCIANMTSFHATKHKYYAKEVTFNGINGNEMTNFHCGFAYYSTLISVLDVQTIPP